MHVTLCQLCLIDPWQVTVVVHWVLIGYEDFHGALGGFTADGALVDLLGAPLTHTHVATWNQCHL